MCHYGYYNVNEKTEVVNRFEYYPYLTVTTLGEDPGNQPGQVSRVVLYKDYKEIVVYDMNTNVDIPIPDILFAYFTELDYEKNGLHGFQNIDLQGNVSNYIDYDAIGWDDETPDRNLNNILSVAYEILGKTKENEGEAFGEGEHTINIYSFSCLFPEKGWINKVLPHLMGNNDEQMFREWIQHYGSEFIDGITDALQKTNVISDWTDDVPRSDVAHKTGVEVWNLDAAIKNKKKVVAQMEGLKEHIRDIGDYMKVDPVTKEDTGEIDMESLREDGHDDLAEAVEGIQDGDVMPDKSLDELESEMSIKSGENRIIQDKRGKVHRMGNVMKEYSRLGSPEILNRLKRRKKKPRRFLKGGTTKSRRRSNRRRSNRRRSNRRRSNRRRSNRKTTRRTRRYRTKGTKRRGKRTRKKT